MMQSVLMLRAFPARKSLETTFTPYIRRKRKEENTVNTLMRDKINILPWGPKMSIDSLILSPVYSCVKELLKKL
jgi:hypothetical protein